MFPLSFAQLPRRCLRFPVPAIGRTYTSSALSNATIAHPSIGRITLPQKGTRLSNLILGREEVQASLTRSRLAAATEALPSCSVWGEAESRNHKLWNSSRRHFASSCSAMLFEASAPAFSSSNVSRPATTTGSTASTSAEKRASTDKSAHAKHGSTASATGAAAPKRMTGLHKICDLKGPLASFMGRSEASRIDVIKHVWDYIKRHNLQSTENKRMINTDHVLKSILQKDQVSMFEINKLLSKHVQNRPVATAGGKE